MMELAFRVAALSVNALSLAVFLRARPEFDASSQALLRRTANAALVLSLVGLGVLVVKCLGAVGGESVDPSQHAHPLNAKLPGMRLVLVIAGIAALPTLLARLANRGSDRD